MRFLKRQDGNYPEDAAFHGPMWAIGRFVPWSLFRLAANYYVELANWRAQTHYTSFPPVNAVMDRQKFERQRENV
jgi:hypothetical protein